MSSAILNNFYTGFSKRDYKTMQSCYAAEARFSDPVFQHLNADETNAMWEMLCRRGRDLKISYTIISADGEQGSVEWVATYTFSQTGRKVVNKVSSRFRFRDGLIVEQEDRFDLHKWAGQALGLPGILLGWTGFFKKKLRKSASQSLQKFMSQPHDRDGKEPR